MGSVFAAVTVAYKEVGEGREQGAEASPAWMLAPSPHGSIYGRTEVDAEVMSITECIGYTCR